MAARLAVPVDLFDFAGKGLGVADRDNAGGEHGAPFTQIHPHQAGAAGVDPFRHQGGRRKVKDQGRRRPLAGEAGQPFPLGRAGQRHIGQQRGLVLECKSTTVL